MENTYFPMFMNMEGKSFLVFGAGKIAARRVEVLLRLGCSIIIEAPVISPEMKAAVEGFKVVMIEREYCQGDVSEEMDYVLAVTDDKDVNERIFRECRHKEVPVNVASDRTMCDFYFPAVVKSENIIIGITSGGSDHEKVRRIATVLREQLREDINQS